MKTRFNSSENDRALCALPSAYRIGLSVVAPSLAFTVSRELDPRKSWDGDGPSPREQGFSPYDVTVTVSAIVNGELIQAEATLGTSWFKPDQPTDNLGGYLNQKLDEAAQDLRNTLEGDLSDRLTGDQCAESGVYCLLREIDEAREWLETMRRAEYEAQRSEKAWSPACEPEAHELDAESERDGSADYHANKVPSEKEGT